VARAAGEERSDERAMLAAQESARLLTEWLGATPPSPQPRRPQLPWRTAPSAMELESAIAYRTAMAYWSASSAEPGIAHGLAWYLQGRLVEHLFNTAYAAPGHSTESLRLFGGHVAYELPSLRLTRGGALAATDGRRRPREIDTSALRSASAFASLERILGWPVLQGALLELAKHRDTPLSSDLVNEVVSAAAGRDLSWFFSFAFNPTLRVEYALRDFVTESVKEGCLSSPCYRTRVTAERLGDVAFTGSSHEPQGEFDAGELIRLEVRFPDGQRGTASWDGRDRQRVFQFESTTPAAEARLDPMGTLVLDSNSLDHSLRREPASNVPLAKWLARWTIWLQHVLLGYAMLI
jgi:hypothetical protein